MSDTKPIDDGGPAFPAEGPSQGQFEHPGTPMALMQQAVANGADVAVLEKMMDLQERFEKNEAAKEFTDALAAFQAECPQIHKNRDVSLDKGRSKAYSFASLDDIMREVQPVLSKFGLSVGFTASIQDGMCAVVCRLRHGLHSEETSTVMPVPDMRVNATQEMGAALSYAKRYALCAALNIQVTDEDNDAANLVDVITEKQVITLKEIAEPLNGAAIQACMRWLGVQAWDEIPANRFDEVKRALVAKVAQQNKAGGK